MMEQCVPSRIVHVAQAMSRAVQCATRMLASYLLVVYIKRI